MTIEMTPADTAAALVLDRAAAFGRIVDTYRAFRADIALVRVAGNAVKVALYRLENTLGDVADVDAYLAALAAGRRCVRTYPRLVSLHAAGTPDR